MTDHIADLIEAANGEIAGLHDLIDSCGPEETGALAGYREWIERYETAVSHAAANRPERVWTLQIDRKHGTDTRAFRTEAGALDGVQFARDVRAGKASGFRGT